MKKGGAVCSPFPRMQRVSLDVEALGLTWSQKR